MAIERVDVVHGRGDEAHHRRRLDGAGFSAVAAWIQEAYAALNRGDVAGFVAAFDPEVERIEPSDFPMAGTYRGIEAVRAHVEKGRGTWAEGACEPERFAVVPGAAGAPDRVIVHIHVRVRLKTETEWREGRIADVFTFRDGRVVQFRTFGDEREAREWAGMGPGATLRGLEQGTRLQNRFEAGLPETIISLAYRAGNGELAWRPEDVSAALAAIAASGQAVLGGEAWLALGSGRWIGLIPDRHGGDFVCAWDTKPRGEEETWQAYCVRAANEAERVIAEMRIEDDAAASVREKLWWNFAYISEPEGAL